MPPRYKPGEPVLLNGTVVKGIVGKIVMVVKTIEKPYEYSYIVEYYKHIHDMQWERVEREFQEDMLLPLDTASRLLYLD